MLNSCVCLFLISLSVCLSLGIIFPLVSVCSGVYAGQLIQWDLLTRPMHPNECNERNKACFMYVSVCVQYICRGRHNLRREKL